MPLGDRGRRDGDVHDDARLPEPRAPRAAALGEQMRGDEQLVPQIFVGVAVRVARRARQRVGEGGEELLGGKGDAFCLVTLIRDRDGLEHVPQQLRAHEDAPVAEIAPERRRQPVQRAGGGHPRRARGVPGELRQGAQQRDRQDHGVVLAAGRHRTLRARVRRGKAPEARGRAPGGAGERAALARVSRRRLPRRRMLLGAIASGAREGANGVGRGDGGARGRALERQTLGDERERAHDRVDVASRVGRRPLHERLGVEAHERAQRLLERLGVAVRDGVVHEPHDLLHVVQLAQGDPAPGIVRAAHAVYGRGVPVAQRRAVRRAQQRHQTRVVHVHRGDGVVTRAVARRRHRGHRPDGDARGSARRRQRLRPPAPRGHARARAARNGGDRAVKPRGSCQSVPLDASKKGICRGERLALIRFSGRHKSDTPEKRGTSDSQIFHEFPMLPLPTLERTRGRVRLTPIRLRA